MNRDELFEKLYEALEEHMYGGSDCDCSGCKAQMLVGFLEEEGLWIDHE